MDNSQIDSKKIFWRLYENLRVILNSPTDKAIAEKLRISPTAFANQKARGTIPIAEIIGLCERRHLSLDQIFGLQPMAQRSFESDHAMIPMYRVEAAGGLDGIVNDENKEPEDQYPFKLSWLESKGYRSSDRLDQLVLIRVRGNSMEPTISDGEAVLVDLDEAVRLPESIKNGAVYLLRWGREEEGISVKRVHLDWAERPIIAESDNELYNPKRIDTGDKPLPWYVLGKVIWVGKENI